MFRRNTMAWVVGAVMLASVAWFAVAQAADQKPGGLVVPTQELLGRIAKLEARVAQLEQQAATPVYLASPAALPNGMPPYAVPAVPDGAMAREFNGHRYYIVPLDKSIPAK